MSSNSERARAFEVGVGLTDAELRSRREQHQAYVISSIVLTTMFLEATINEVYQDLVEGRNDRRFSDDVVKRIQALASTLNLIESTSIALVTKYRLLLDVADAAPFPWGSMPAQDVQLILALRNALVHFRPSAHLVVSSDGSLPIDKKKLEKQLQGKFALNPLEASNMSFFPDRCLSYGCARYCLETITAFTDQYFAHLGVKPPYDHVRDIALI